MKPLSILGAIAILILGFDGLDRARLWVSPNGRVELQSVLPGQESALGIWPTLDPNTPTQHAISELTIHRRLWDDPCTERLNVSAMAVGDYRFGIERGDTCPGPIRNFVFCFDTPPGSSTPWVCPFLIRPDGVFVGDAQHQWHRVLTER